MARWPQVPDVYGWLRLDARGQWYLIDRQQPGFDAAVHGRGSPITSPGIVDFLGRNYGCDARGCWYWQNGPQRAYAELDLAPLIYRVLNREALQAGHIELVSHTGYPVQQLHAVALDAGGRLWIRSEQGPGIIHDLDASLLQIDEGPAGLQVRLGGQDWPVGDIDEGDRFFGFARSPLSLQSAKDPAS